MTRSTYRYGETFVRYRIEEYLLIYIPWKYRNISEVEGNDSLSILRILGYPNLFQKVFMSKSSVEKITAFNENSAQVAKAAMDLIDPSLSKRYSILIEFLTEHPKAANIISRKKEESKIVIGSDEYIKLQAYKFSDSRKPHAPKPPDTVPDKMVSFIINKYFNVPENELKKAVELHSLSMGAENLIGDILERYIASVVESQDWVWCSGSIVSAVDFIYKKENGWAALQIKNRDNSENSSSASVRKNTEIKKWYRTFSKKVGDNWNKFPPIADVTLSEIEFKNYVTDYLNKFR
jgi:SinI restriction endonuclease